VAHIITYSITSQQKYFKIKNILKVQPAHQVLVSGLLHVVPTRGTTRLAWQGQASGKISIHAPARGTTLHNANSCQSTI